MGVAAAEEVAALRVEAVNDDPPPFSGGKARAHAAPESSEPDLKPVLYGFVAVGGKYACRHYRVPPLEKSEIELLAEAINNLVEAYDWTIKDPKVAAWLGLGAAAMAVVMPRLAHLDVSAPAAEPQADAA